MTTPGVITRLNNHFSAGYVLGGANPTTSGYTSGTILSGNVWKFISAYSGSTIFLLKVSK